MLDAHQLNVFLVAAETLNFTQTARRLHMTQPSVSQHIHSLEKHFGIDLFIRKGRQLELTGAGMALAPLARDMVRLSIRIEETMESLKGEVSGHLLVSCSTTPGKYVLPQLLARFHHQFPSVKVTCEVTAQQQAVQLLCSGDVHFALSSAEQMDPETIKEAEFQNFIYDTLTLVAPVDHPWALRGMIEPEDLYEGSFIMREPQSGTYIAARDALSDLGIDIDKLKVLLTLGNSEAIAIAVQEGIGVGFVSNVVLTRLVKDKVVPIQVRGLEVRRAIYMGQQTNRPATAAQSAFWEFINSLDSSEFTGFEPVRLGALLK